MRREPMKFAGFVRNLLILLSGFLLTSCMLPGMIPLNQEPEGPMPTMETDGEKLLETLKGGDWVYLQQLAKEEYTDEDYAEPGTLTYTVTITDATPTYFNYGWCTTTEETLAQNFEHINIRLLFNDKALGEDVVHALTSTRPDGFVCLEFGVLMSDWSPGEYKLESIATFDEKINDGAADFEAGDYVFVYNVTVE
jgi:hypothetical protein